MYPKSKLSKAIDITIRSWTVQETKPEIKMLKIIREWENKTLNRNDKLLTIRKIRGLMVISNAGKVYRWVT